MVPPKQAQPLTAHGGASVGQFWRRIAGSGSIGRYGIIGITGMGLDFVLFYFLLRAGTVPLLATALSTLAGITNNFIWNSLINFKTDLSSRRGAKFLLVGLLGLLCSAALLQLFMWNGVGALQAKWLSIPLVVIAQFTANRMWTFRKATI